MKITAHINLITHPKIQSRQEIEIPDEDLLNLNNDEREVYIHSIVRTEMLTHIEFGWSESC